jgi:hypothetical protein
MSDFVKILPVGQELFQADRQTDRHDKTNSHFAKFFESAQKGDVSGKE